MQTAWIWPARELPRGDEKILDFPATPGDRASLALAATDARAALHAAALAAAEAANRARAVADALDRALLALEAPAQKPVTVARESMTRGGEAGSRSALSPREREVLALVAEGRSNKAIAEALYVSPNTVKTHVASLLSKLQADTRVQLAAMAVQQQCL